MDTSNRGQYRQILTRRLKSVARRVYALPRLVTMVIGYDLLFVPIRPEFRRGETIVDYRPSAGSVGMWSNHILRTWGHQSWLRVPMYNMIAEFLERNFKRADFEGRIAIEIGGSEGSLKQMLEELGCRVIVAPAYPEVDIQNLPWKDDTFDFVIADQVFEHIPRPWVAVDEVYRILRGGGVSIVTAPFIHAYHSAAGWADYWRFTPDAWSVLFSRFEVLTADGWGHADAVRTCWVSSDIGPSLFTTPLQQGVELGLLREGDHINYMMTWCIARKTKHASGPADPIRGLRAGAVSAVSIER